MRDRQRFLTPWVRFSICEVCTASLARFSLRFSLMDLPCGFLSDVCFGDLSPMVSLPHREPEGLRPRGRYAVRGGSGAAPGTGTERLRPECRPGGVSHGLGGASLR